MCHLIVCCDGTWNMEGQAVTNVQRLWHALAERDADADGHEQRSHYQSGVGAVRNKLLGGALGVGLSAKLIEAYQWLTTNYRPGDRISLFGFSRGAYTARSLAGMISHCGLIDVSKMDVAKARKTIKKIYDRGYRRRHTGDRKWRNGLTFLYDPDDQKNVPVHFIGVWDTVGALGIPDYMGWLNLMDPLHLYDFHDLKLNPHIKHARHAVAIDERRRPYTPALWEPAPGQDVKQVWFPGSHLDVGGGHPERGLSDGALGWMIDEAREAAGLVFRKELEAQIHADPLDVLHDDDRGVVGALEPLSDLEIKPVLEIVLQPRPRAVPLIDSINQNPDLFHSSVYERQEDSSIDSGRYWPTKVLAPGEAVTVEVDAGKVWNQTGLYLGAGDYCFSAKGQWLDSGIPSGPGGTEGIQRFNPLVERLRLLCTMFGRGQKLFQFATGNKIVNSFGVRRKEDMPWMSLIGVVANDIAEVGNDYKEHEYIGIGDGTCCRVSEGGYFYAFANDAWGFYGNNWGSVRLTVSRMPKAGQSSVATNKTRKNNPQPSNPKNARGREGSSRPEQDVKK